MKKRFMGILLTLCMALTLLPATALAAENVTILSYPAKTEYTVGEGFDRTGIKAVATIGGEKKDISSEISFRNSGNATLNQGTVFATKAGKQEITLRWTAPGEKTSQIVGKYTVASSGEYVAPAQAAPTPVAATYQLYDAMDNGWYSIRLGYVTQHDTFIDIDAAGDAVLRAGGRDTKFYIEKKRIVDRDWAEITIKMADGRYLGIVGEIDDRAMYKVGTNPVYRSKPDGDIVGELPAGAILEVTQIKGDWAKVKYEGQEYYMWAARLTKVNTGGARVAAVNQPYLWQIEYSYDSSQVAMRPAGNPKLMVMPAEKTYPDGAKAILSEYIPYLKNISFEDWGRSINNMEMAELLDGVFFTLGLYGTYFEENLLKWTSDIPNDKLNSMLIGEINRLYGWRVFTNPNMDWRGVPTYGEFTSYLIKLMDYNKSQSSSKFSVFTNDTIESFAIGGDTSSNAKITWEQASTLQHKTIQWAAAEWVRIGEWSGLGSKVKTHRLAAPWNLTSSGKLPLGQSPAPTPTPAPAPTPAVPAGITAAPSQTGFVMNSRPVSVTAAYSINNTNYLQLRAIAALLSGSAAQFDVGWDGQYAVIEPGRPYSGAVSQTKLQNTANVRPSGTKFKLNGEVFTFTDARLIDGDTNYLQLREFAQKLSGTASQFNVYYDSAAGQAVIQPGAAYSGNK